MAREQRDGLGAVPWVGVRRRGLAGITTACPCRSGVLAPLCVQLGSVAGTAIQTAAHFTVLWLSQEELTDLPQPCECT